MKFINETVRYEPFCDEVYKNMPSADGISNMVVSNYILGDVSGKIEWTQQPDKARNTFLHLSAYENFIDENQLILLGRTGSGKSAIIYGLKDDIEKKKVTRYSDAIQIDEKEFCEKLAELCSDIDINRFDATNKITSAIVVTIYTKVMLYCFDTFASERSKLKYTIKYLLSQNFIRTKSKSLLDKIDQLSSEQLEEEFNAISKNDIVSNVFGIARLLSKTREIIKTNDETSIIDDVFCKHLTN